MRLVGVDEAGRGSFVGPLVVGAFAIDGSHLAEVRATGARDSKELTPAARESIYQRLLTIGEAGSVSLSPREVDRAVRIRGLNRLEARAFGREVARSAGAGVRIVARHHADRDDPLVGAASIVAKVRRDRELAALCDSVGGDLGSGYPSDPQTIEFVRSRLAPGSPTPPWLRASWATMTRVKRAAPAALLP